MTSKYGNRFTDVDGYVFRSAAEANRYTELKLLAAGGVIAALACQPRYPVVINGTLVTTYVADFSYDDLERGTFVVEDVKGVRTALYKLKKKLVEASYGIEITEIAV